MPGFRPQMRWLFYTVLNWLLLSSLSDVSAEIAPRIAVAGFRPKYETSTGAATSNNKKPPTKKEWLKILEQHQDHCILPRLASAERILRLWDNVRKRDKSFRQHRGADGRFGRISSTNLGHDWVLAESDQIAVDCTPSDVLRAYLSGSLQKIWNKDSVLDCHFTLVEEEPVQEYDSPYYRQDLILKSQRVI